MAKSLDNRKRGVDREIADIADYVTGYRVRSERAYSDQRRCLEAMPVDDFVGLLVA